MSMDKKIALIGNPNEFLAKSLKNALENLSFSYEVHNIEYNIDALYSLKGEVTGLVFFIEAASGVRSFLNYAKDFMSDNRLYGILIGERVEIAEASKSLTGCKFISCARPVDIPSVIQDIERLDEEQKKESEKRSILVIDDDTCFLSTIKDKLKNAYTVYVANSGTSGIMILTKHQVDLILLDIEMPVMSGTKVMEMLKNEPKLSSIPVIYLTGRSDVKTVIDAMATKPENFLTKAQPMDELYAAIGAFFEKSRIPTLYNTKI